MDDIFTTIHDYKSCMQIKSSTPVKKFVPDKLIVKLRQIDSYTSAIMKTDVSSV